MRKRNSSALSNNDDLKKPPPRRVDDEEEDDRKPAATRGGETDSQPETDQSVGSNASSSTVPTVACTPLAACSPNASSTAKGADLNVPLATIEENPNTPLQQFTTQAALLGSTSALSLLAFVAMMLPTEALVALTVAMGAMMLLVFQSYQFALQAYADAINGRGIGDYLPRWVFNMLVEDSIHDQLTDDNFPLDLRPMALYFFPGLTPTQIDGYVDRLPARHRDFLRRPGAGHVLGDEFMQLILGRERYPEIPPSENNTSALVESTAGSSDGAAGVLPPPSSGVRRLDWGDDDSSAESDFELQGTSRHFIGGLSANRVGRLTRTLGLSSNNSGNNGDRSASSPPPSTNQSPPQAIVATPAAPTNNNDDDADYELQILTEAFFQGMNSFVLTPVLYLTSQAAGRVADMISTPSVSMTIFSGSVGLFGLWRGLWGRSGLRANTGLHDRDVWATAVLGGGVAGVLLFVRANSRQRRSDTKK